MTDLIYDAIVEAPGLRPDGVWTLMLVVAAVQAVFLLPALMVLGSMRAHPWTTTGKTTLGNVTNKQFLGCLLTAGILVGPAMSAFLAIEGDWLSIGRYAFTLAACLGVLIFYPALLAFRSMIPGARGSMEAAARGPVLGLLAIGLLSVPLLAGGFVASRNWEELRSSLARGDYLTTIGTLDRVTIRSTEEHARRSVWFEEHDTFTLGGGEVFKIACIRQAREPPANGHPYTCLRADIGDRLTVGYRKARPHGSTQALRVWRDNSRRN